LSKSPISGEVFLRGLTAAAGLATTMVKIPYQRGSIPTEAMKYILLLCYIFCQNPLSAGKYSYSCGCKP